ncbi:MAG TPA: DUF5916 domain-containing protein [Candidatus Tumulicola sp.]|nr:DUF5916 domain-containing protein [Candidatus Tumulicola sp.]
MHQKRWLSACVAILVIFALAPSLARATASKDQKFPAVRAPHAMPLDASLSDPAWKTGLVANDFINFTAKVPPKMDTVAYLLYDDQNLYVAFHCEQAGTQVVATQSTDNLGFGLDDYVAVGFDTSGNGTQVYDFEATPRGVRYQHSTENVKYQPPWQVAVSNVGTGWNAVMVIPLKNLRAQSAKEQSWRISFQRHLASSSEDYSWAYSRQMGYIGDSTYWPTLSGLQLSGALTRPKPRAEFYGLSSSGSDRNRFPQLNGTAGPASARHVGLDATYPFTSSLAFVGTLNPDFSNVESDQQVITPQQFQRALTEYRPFFAQGQNFLTPTIHLGINYPANEILYTPSFGSFGHGEKVEGTVGLNAVGALAVKGPGFSDQAFGINHITADHADRYFVAGVMAHHTGDGSSVIPCPVLNSVQLPSCRDSVLTAGFRISSLKTGAEAAFEYGGESGDYVPNSTQARNFITIESVNRANYDGHLAYRDVGPYYSPVDGFTLINDIRGPAVTINGQGSGSPNSAIKRYDGGVSAERYVDRSGAARFAQDGGYFDLVFKNLLDLNGALFDSEQRQYDIGFPVYSNGQTFSSHTQDLALNYRDGTPKSVDGYYLWGPSAGFLPSRAGLSSFYFQEWGASSSYQLGTRYSVAGNFVMDRLRCFDASCNGHTYLRRVNIGETFGPNSNISLGVRGISGTLLSPSATNFVAAFHRKFATGSELFVDYGAPSTTYQLNRLVVKYVLHLGGGTGT